MTDLPAGHILVLSGSPGSGKTTTAERLALQPGVPKVHLHTDDFWGYIKTGKIDPWLHQSHRQNQMIMAIAATVAAEYARHGYFVVVDGVVRPWALEYFRALGVPLHAVVLRTSVAAAVTRCQARGGDSLTDPDVVAALHAEFADLGALERHVIRSDGDAATTVERVAAAVSSNGLRVE